MGKVSRKLGEKGLTPGSRVDAKVEWYLRYKRNRRFLESEAAYAKRTGDKRPSWLW